MIREELRQGNYLYYENTTHIVCGIINNRVYSWWVKDGQPIIEYEAKDISGTQVENPYMDVISQYEEIPLSDEWMMRFGFIKQKEDGQWGPIYKRSDFDVNYVLTRDWREGSSYHFGMEYTDAPDPNDDFIVHNFTHEIKFVHQLQNIWLDLIHKEITNLED